MQEIERGYYRMVERYGLPEEFETFTRARLAEVFRILGLIAEAEDKAARTEFALGLSEVEALDRIVVEGTIEIGEDEEVEFRVYSEGKGYELLLVGDPWEVEAGVREWLGLPRTDGAGEGIWFSRLDREVDWRIRQRRV